MTSAVTLALAGAPFPTLLRAGAASEEVVRWLQLARTGDCVAIGSLLDLYRERVLNLAWQVLRDRDAADDAAQEVFVRAFENLPRFRGESEFGTWLYRLALNYCLERQRHEARRSHLAPQVSWEEDPDLENAPSLRHAVSSYRVEHGLEKQVETRLALEAALDALPESLRWPLVLREWHGLSYEEIAKVLRLPVGTVRSRLHKGRSSFIEIWEANHATE